MLKKITLGTRQVEYYLTRKRIKNINIRIKSDLSVSVSAPNRVSVKEIENLLITKTDFILNALDKYEQRQKNSPKPLGYKSGDTVILFGEHMKLTAIRAEKNEVGRIGGEILLATKTDDTELKKKTLDKWLRQQCKGEVIRACEKVYPDFQRLGVQYPEITFRKMSARWGSCRPFENRLCFNTELYKMPRAFIEYVAAHEFTHFLNPNHSKDFYRQLEMIMPDWKERKRLSETSC